MTNFLIELKYEILVKGYGLCLLLKILVKL